MLDAFERFYISTWDTMNPKRGYNKESGGNALKYFSKESREKMSKAQSGENNAGYRFDLKENINIISKLYEEGHTPQYIGEQFNADSTTIRKHLRDNSISLRDISEAKRGEKNGMYGKIPKNKRLDIDSNIEEIAKEYENGEPLTQLAKKWGVHRRTMRRKLRMIYSKEEMDKINKKNKSNKIIKKNLSEGRKGISSWNKGKNYSEEKKLKYSKSKTKTGIYRVYLGKKKGRKNKFIQRYEFKNKNEKITLSSTDLNQLEQKVKEKDYSWIILDEEKYKKSLEINQKILNKNINNLWDTNNVYFRKSDFNRQTKNLVKPFRAKYNSSEVKCGSFHDFITPTIIHNIIKENSKDETYSQ